MSVGGERVDLVLVERADLECVAVASDYAISNTWMLLKIISACTTSHAF